MRIKTCEMVEVSEAITSKVRIRDRLMTGKSGSTERLEIEAFNGDWSIYITGDEIDIGFKVHRPGHDHSDTARIKIKGLKWVEPEGEALNNTNSKIPVLVLSEMNSWRMPKIEGAERFLDDALSGGAEDYQFGEGKENLVIHAYTLPWGTRHGDCISMIGVRGALDRAMKLIGFKKKEEY